MPVTMVDTDYISVGYLIKSQEHYFEIPKYQRDYAWEAEEVEDFCQDIFALASLQSTTPKKQVTHFFGAIVLVEGESPGKGRRRCELVDGQQRLTTFFLLLAAVRTLLRDLGENATNRKVKANAIEAAKQIGEEYLQFRSISHGQYSDQPRITPSVPDREFFFSLLDGGQESPTRDSHYRLMYASSKIHSCINEILPVGHTAARFAKLESLRSLLDENCFVVRMMTSDQAAGYNLFAVLNDRGKALSTGNLLRAESLAIVEEFKTQQKTIERNWDEILRDKAARTDDFVSWHYSAYRGTRIRSKDMFRDFRDSFFLRRPAQIDGKVAGHIQAQVIELKNSVVTMRELIEGRWPRELAAPVTEWDEFRLRMLVKHLGHTNCMPLLLAASRLPDRRFSEVIRAIELFAFRYHFICKEHIGPATRIYEQHAKLIIDSSSTYQTKHLRVALRSLLAEKTDDEVFSQTLISRMNYEDSHNRQLIKYFLLTLSDYWGWYVSSASGPPSCSQNHRVISFDSSTIEHVYPRSAKAADVDSDIEPIKDSLGNLTILGPNENSNIGNESFKKKRSVFKSSAIEMNHQIGQRPNWTKACIEAREKVLVQAALRIFSS